MTAEVPDPQGLGDAPLSSVSDDSMTHPSFDTSASLLQQDQQEQQMQHSNEPSDAASHMSASLPLTPQTQRTSDKQGELDVRDASSSHPVLLCQRILRRHRVVVVAFDTSDHASRPTRRPRL